ncbi:response regulator [Heliobacterium chlorum]|uniref:Stage 0 sporulation protein A homolog n=1 Tax=Heliobacterium chlorum TaxID=2698 RepID=A0ABR7SYP9_HELCL|nr:response regulator [Heliobacterium chlorum]MBC9783658.1 response regulator [Heliobacterium chlorum]
MKSDRKILVVDDQTGVRSLLRIILQDAGYEVITVGNGLDALRKVEELNPPLVLMDVRMPGLDGFQAMERMLKINHDIKVVLMTAYSDEALIQRALEQGAIDYMTKPFDVYELRKRIDTLWETVIEESRWEKSTKREENLRVCNS